jgi:hypothetical protein
MEKNPFLISEEELKKIAHNFKRSRCSVSHMNNLQKYKNKYSRIAMKAVDFCRYYK